MKIPRYQGGGAASGLGGNRSLSTGAQQGSQLAAMGSQALSLLSDYGAAKVQFTAQMRDLEINTMNENGKNESILHNDDFVFGLNDRTDYSNWEDEYRKSYGKLLNKKTKDMDEFALSQHKPFHDFYFAEGLRSVRKAVNERKLLMADRAYRKSESNVIDTFRTADSSKDILSAYNTFVTGTLTPFSKTQHMTGEGFGASSEKVLAEANSGYIRTQVIEGLGANAKIMSPDGVENINWNEAAKNLADPNVVIKTVDGKELTVDDPLRQAAITAYREKATNQNTFFETRRVEIKRKTVEDITSAIVDYRLNGGNDTDFASIAGAITSNKEILQSGDEKTLMNMLTGAQNDLKTAATTGKLKHETNEAEQVRIMVSGMVEAGIIDTQEEKSIVLRLIAEGYYSEEGQRTILDRIDTKIRNINRPTQMHYKRAIKMIAKEISGGSSLLDTLDMDGSMSAADTYQAITSVLGAGAEDQAAFTAINNLNELLAEGERKGISKRDMLMNPNSPHYLVDEIIKIYKGDKLDEKIENFTQKATQYIEGLAQSGNSSDPDFIGYRINPAGWIASQTVTTSGVSTPPVRGANEGITQYLVRLQAWNDQTGGQTSGEGLPSFLRGNTMESDGASRGIIIPD